jgi:5-methylcytosine-specific restriction enzyme B
VDPGVDRRLSGVRSLIDHGHRTLGARARMRPRALRKGLAMATREVRSGLLLRTCLEFLRDRAVRVPKREVYAEVARRVDLTSVESAVGRGSVPPWVIHVGYHTSIAAGVGLMVKMDAHWSITEAGLAALELHPSGDALLQHTWGRYREIVTGRHRSHERREAGLVALAEALDRVPRGTWTAFEDLAAIAGATVDEVADLLVTGEALPASHRILTSDGEVPLPTMVHASVRGADLRARLMAEGVEFYGVRANPEQRVPIEILRDTAAAQTRSRRAWLVRVSSDGGDPGSAWPDEPYVCLPELLLTDLDPDAGAAALRRAVADTYQHTSYAVRERLVSDLDAFLRRMQPDDIVLAVADRVGGAGESDTGEVHLAIVDGPPEFVRSGHRRVLRRPVRWLSRSHPVHLADLPAPLLTLMRAHTNVVDLTGGLAWAEDLLDQAEGDRTSARPPRPPQPVLPSPPAELAERLLLDQVWLSGIAELLRQRHQIVFYGPPGTGKTYLAMGLAERLADPHAVALVQMHPAFTYADLVEGFRPEAADDGTERVRLRAGPLRRLADEAREHPGSPYVLVIDEINRGDLATILGEVYLLLEYRDRPITMPASQDNAFTLPHNLYLIATMNTADRPGAGVDAGLRRRFAFVEMHPSRPPVAGLLRRWLHRHGYDESAADLLDRLNELLTPTGHAVGPSYLMRDETYTRPDGLELVWRYDILPLLADWQRDVDVMDRYSLAALRTSLTQHPATR